MSVEDICSTYTTPPRSCVTRDEENFISLRKEIDALRREVDYLRLIIFKGDIINEKPKKQFKVPIEIKLPTFRDEHQDNPVVFMNSFDQYCAIKEVPEEYVPILIESALKERAGLWFQVAKYEINGLSDFKNAFADEFFSVEIKTQAKNNWRDKRYNEQVDGQLLSFFYKQTNEISNIDPDTREYEKNYIILKQFPLEVQMALSGINLNETKALKYAIARQDDIQRSGKINFKGEENVGNGWRKNAWGASNRQIDDPRGSGYQIRGNYGEKLKEVYRRDEVSRNHGRRI